MTEQVDHKTLDADQQNALGEMSTALGQYQSEYGKASGGITIGLHPDARESLRVAQQGISAGFYAATSGREQADKTSLDDTIFPDGRSRMTGELLDGAQQESDQIFNRAEGNIDMAEARMTVDAVRPVDKFNATLARQDTRMMLDSLGPLEAAERMTELAQRNDDVAGLVSGQWGHDYLTMRGADQVNDVHNGIRRAHLQVQADSGDADRRINARHALAIPRLRKALAAARSASGFALKS